MDFSQKGSERDDPGVLKPLGGDDPGTTQDGRKRTPLLDSQGWTSLLVSNGDEDILPETGLWSEEKDIRETVTGP